MASKLESTQRSSSQQPAPVGGLPSLAAPKPTLPNVPVGRFQSMVYNRNYILNIDNQTTNRNNQHYISGYYKQLSDQAIIPAQQALTYKSLRNLDARSPMRSTTQVQPERILNSNSEIK